MVRQWRQTHSHLFIRCRRWSPEIRRLWQRVETDCEWGPPKAPSVCLLFRDERAIPTLLGFLEDTRVGRMPSVTDLQALGAEDEDVEDVEHWQESDEGTEGEEDGPGPP